MEKSPLFWIVWLKQKIFQLNSFGGLPIEKPPESWSSFRRKLPKIFFLLDKYRKVFSVYEIFGRTSFLRSYLENLNSVEEFPRGFFPFRYFLEALLLSEDFQEDH